MKIYDPTYASRKVKPLCVKCMSRFCQHIEPTPARLTPRCVSIVKLIGGGLGNKEIANILGLSPGTVKVYVSRDIFPALELETRLQVALWALRNADLLQEQN